MPLPSHAVLELRAGDARAAVDPRRRRRLTALAFAGFDFLTDEGSFVMAPWAGRTGYGSFTFDGADLRAAGPRAARAPRHPRHGAGPAVGGRVRRPPPGAADRRPRARTGRGTGGASRSSPSIPTPSASSCRCTAGTERFPAVLGWHPWFADPDNTAVVAAALLQRGDDHLPTGVRLHAAGAGAVRPARRLLRGHPVAGPAHVGDARGRADASTRPAATTSSSSTRSRAARAWSPRPARPTPCAPARPGS